MSILGSRLQRLEAAARRIAPPAEDSRALVQLMLSDPEATHLAAASESATATGSDAEQELGAALQVRLELLAAGAKEGCG